MARGEPGEPEQLMDGKVVLITGAARGIGAESARQLAARGARVALLGLEPAELERVAAACGPSALWREVDVTDGPALEAAVADVVERCGGLDAAVANAGIAALGPSAEVEPEAFQRVIDINLVGAWRTMRATLPALKARRGYLLVNTSVTAIVPFLPLSGAYAASKAGLEGLALTMRAELRHYGVDVGVAYFGFIETDLVSGADEHPAGKLLRESAPFPLNRTHPVSLAGKAVADGVARRRKVVVAPWWVKGLLPLRGLFHLASSAQKIDEFEQAERLWREDAARRGLDASTVGRGGEAAMRPR